MIEIKEGFYDSYPAFLDKRVSLFLIQHKQNSIPEHYENIYNALFNELKEWEDYIQKCKTVYNQVIIHRLNPYFFSSDN